MVNDIDLAPIGSIDRRETTTFNYDQQNRPTGRSIAVDIGADGSVENTLNTVFTLDNKSRLLTSVGDLDTNNDGFADQVNTVTNTY